MDYSLFIKKDGSIGYADIYKGDDGLFCTNLFQVRLCDESKIRVLNHNKDIPFIEDDEINHLREELYHCTARAVESKTLIEAINVFLDFWGLPSKNFLRKAMHLNEKDLLEKLDNLKDSEWILVVEISEMGINGQFGFITLYNNEFLSLETENEEIIGKKIIVNKTTKEKKEEYVKIETILEILSNHTNFVHEKGLHKEVVERIKVRGIERKNERIFTQIISLM